MEEKWALAASMAERQMELERLEDQKKAVAADLKGKMDTVQAVIRREANVYRQGWEMRDVECTKIVNRKEGTLRVIREDTLEVVHGRRLTQEEMQLKLPLDGY